MKRMRPGASQTPGTGTQVSEHREVPDVLGREREIEYLEPPFNSNRDSNGIVKDESGNSGR